MTPQAKNGTMKTIKWAVTIILVTAGAIASCYAIVDSLRQDIHKNAIEITKNCDSNKTVHEKIQAIELQMEKGFGELEKDIETNSQQRKTNDSAMLYMLIKISGKIDKLNGDSL